MRITVLVLVLSIAPSAAAQAIFTEYVEGSSFNKALEITNTCGAPLALSSCRVLMYFNGEESPGREFMLRGTLETGRAHVFHHQDQGRDYAPDHEAAIASAATEQGAGIGWFNRNDVIVLECNGQVVDTLGQIGSEDNRGADTTFRRSDGPGKTDPSAPWNPADYGWEALPQDTFDGLGTP